VNEERMAVEIRDAFDRDYEPNRGLEERVVAAIPWEVPRRRRLSSPRVAGAFAGVLAAVVVVILVAPTVLTRLNLAFPGYGGGGEPPAYSLAAVTGDSVFVIQRNLSKPGSVLLQSKDGGRTWTARLRFDTEYDGMQMFGRDGYLWAIELSGKNCGALEQACHPERPIGELSLYRTADDGATWTQLKSPTAPAGGVYFLDAQHGWVSSGSSVGPGGNDFLYGTSDGGNTWTYAGPLPQSAPMSWVYGVGLYHVTFSDPQRGWYLGNGLLFTTDDGGHTWTQLGGLHRPAGTTLTYSQPVFSGRDGILPVAYRDVNGPDNATANQLYFYVTHDGGAGWGQTGRPAPAGFAPVGDLLSITILDSQHIWLTSQSLTGGDNVQTGPAVARTADGGISWTVTHQPWRILEMTFKDATHGYALDVTGDHNVNGILSTSDAGATWQRVNVPVF
jgi:photosystem II stability/assembly factor-like uncharacterized protein